MEQMTLTEAMNEMTQALATLEVAKEDCKTVIDATFDAYSIVPEGLTKAAAKELLASRKTEKKNLIKLAKAMMLGEKDKAREEAENMTVLIDSLD
jgi:hypothetical protein